VTSTPLDAAARLLYRVAYAAARAWWRISRPRTAGALVACWADERLLLLRTSYRPAYSLPGGFVRPGERVVDTAMRETLEEVGLGVRPEQLTVAWHGTCAFESREDTVTIFEARVDIRPFVRIDGREIVWAGWKSADEALAMPLLPHVRAYLQSREGGAVTRR
jgi:ADP-ribose pyrophosphatase YjhB (NUDIX family)